MSVQTKLTREMKTYIKEVLREKQNKRNFEVFQFPEERVTVGVHYIEGHNAARVFVSLAGPDETKFREKVGEYQVRLAFDEWFHGGWYIGVPYSVPSDYSTADIAQSMAFTVGNIG